jgi:predicted lactoylglutathione lyase
VNLPIENLKKSVDFFKELGFTFNEQFTDEESTCKIADRNTTEVTLSFACESKDEVRTLSEKAFALGAKKVNEPEDIGFMFSWGFEDLDGHMWDLFWMNPEHIQ